MFWGYGLRSAECHVPDFLGSLECWVCAQGLIELGKRWARVTTAEVGALSFL